MNHEAVYRTAPATPGLLITTHLEENASKSSSKNSLNPLLVEEAAELLEINMEDLQIDGNLHRDAENEVYDDDEDLFCRLQNNKRENENQHVVENDIKSPKILVNISLHQKISPRLTLLKLYNSRKHKTLK